MTSLGPIASPQPGCPDASRRRAMLAHDVRCALHAILGGVAMFDRAALTPALWDQLDRIEAASRSLSRLVGDLLGEAPRGGAAGPADAEPADAEPVDVPGLLRHLGRLWRGVAREEGVELRVAAAPDAPSLVRAEPVSLERVLSNLVCNALRHGGAGPVDVEAARSPEGGLALTVRDRGRGLAAAAPRAGAGLGLRIAADLSAAMGARFALLDRPDGGTEARIDFPAGLCVAAAAPDPAPPDAAAELRGLRVLFAEDNPTNQVVGMQMLRALGAEAVLGVDGMDALEKFEAGRFDLVVADIEMPRLSGLDLIRAIRGRGDARARTPIVALTAFAMPEHRARIAAAGANGLVSKPVLSVEALGRALRAHVASAPEPAAPAAPASGTPDGSDGPVADLDVFEALRAAMGDEMIGELIEKVEIDLLQAGADLEGALEPLAPATLRSASHILISVAGAVGAVRLQGRARRLNAAAHAALSAGDPAEAAVLRDDARRCIDEIAPAVAFVRGRRPAE